MPRKTTTKKWFQSKTVWLGIVQSLLSSLDLVQSWLQAGELSAEGAIGLVAGVAIIWVRFVTKTPIAG